MFSVSVRFIFFLFVVYDTTTTKLCNSSSGHPYGLCDTADVITARNGSIVGNHGVDCTRVILAPQGWRIRLTVHKDIFMSDASLYIYDGGTRRVTRNNDYGVGEVSLEDDVFYSTANAIAIHTDKITGLFMTILNMSFVMFRQSPKRCSCPPVSRGETSCTLGVVTIDDRRFYSGYDDLERHCTSTCQQGYEAFTDFFSSTTARLLEIKCKLDQTEADPIWKASKSNTPVLKSVTCNKVNPSHQIMSSFQCNYNTPCKDINIDFIRNEVSEYIMNTTNASYPGECFKSIEVNLGDSNCTVTRLNVSCLNRKNQNTSQVTIRVEDNVKVRGNQTFTQQMYNKLRQHFNTRLPKTLEEFLTNQLRVNNESATNFAPISFGKLLSTCPDNAVLKSGVQGHAVCVSCPKHYQKESAWMNLFHHCSKCPKGMRRESSEASCVVGGQNYSKPSFEYCQHTCALGKFFNNNSGICEWCPYGAYQNSTGDVNPVCRSCPGGRSTGFVGAKSEADCIYLCPEGHYFKYPACVECATGYFMPNRRNRIHKCHKCSASKTTLNFGTKNESGCVDKCSVGQYFNISKGGCVLCPNNTYQDEVKGNNTRSCKNCPSMTVTANVGSKTLLECLGPCGAGQFVDIQIRNCTPCPRDTYHDIAEHVSFTCKPCGEYKVTQNTGSVNISECIYTCNQGEFFNKTINLCEKCPINTYQDQFGKDMCMPCSGKTFTLKNGSKECINPCLYGQLLNKSAEKCQDCPEGYYQNISDHKLESCFPCPLDFYNNKLGRRNCTACTGQTITLITAASRLSDCVKRCEPGTFLNKTSKNCQECMKGFYQDQQQYRLHDCVKCPSLNLTTIGSGASSVEQCVGYCTSHPCLNGGECIDIDNGFNCTCAQHLSGKSCEVIIDEKDTDSMKVSVRFPDLMWNKSLSNPKSQEFIELARNVEGNVREEFKNDANFRTVKVKEFRPGSVISDLEFNSVYGLNFTAPVDTLSSIIADGKLGNLTVDKSSLKVVNFTCTQPLGMEDGRIPDNAITSLETSFYVPLKNARLNFPGPGWAAQIISNNVYLQVDLQEEVILTGVATQGSTYHGGSWLKAYYLQYSLDGNNWSYYQRDSVQYDVLHGNTDVNTTVRNELKYQIRTRHIRVFEYHFKEWISYRIEFYGCPFPETVPLPTQPPFPTHSTPSTLYSTTLTQSTGLRNSSTVTVAGADDNDGADVGLIVGLVLGGVALIVLIIVAVMYLHRKNKYSQRLGHDSSVDVVEMKNASSL